MRLACAVSVLAFLAAWGGSAAIAQSAGSALQFVPVTPCRVADTRNPPGTFGGPVMSAKNTREFDIPQSACGIPSTAAAYSLNVTVVPIGPLGYLSMWPTGQTQPLVSTLNSIDGRVKANAAIVPAGTNGGVDVYVTDASHVILDIDGYFVPAGTDSALSFYPVAPCRVVDTRNPAGSLGGPSIGAKSSRDFPVQSSSCGIPATATAYSLNVTAVPKGPLGYLTIWPTGATQPLVSTLNSYSGGVVANAAMVPAGTSGQVSVYVSDASDVVMDINGYFAPSGTGGLSLYTVAPCRALDTRTAAGAFTGVLMANIEGSTCAPPSAAQAYVLNATVVPNHPLGYLSLWPDTETQPLASTLNAIDGAVTSNMAILPTLNGKVDTYSTDPTNLILDISSYFAPAPGLSTAESYAAFTQNWITEFDDVVNTSVLGYVGPVTDSSGWLNYTVVDQQGNNTVAVHVPSASSRLDVVFIGDSITYLLPFYQKLPELATANVSISGQTCAQMAARFATDVVALNPKAVVIACGTNDSYLTSLTTSEQNISSMVAQARSAGIEVIVATAPPVTSAHPTLAPFIRQLNSYIRSTYVNVWERWYPLVDGTDGYGVTSYYLSDGIHPSVGPAPDMMIGGNLRWALSNADGGNAK
jgi:hypothetical protein